MPRPLSLLRRELHAIAGGFPATFWWLWAGTLVNALGQFVFPFLALYLVGRGFSVGEAGAIVAGMGLGSIFAAPIGGVLADRIGRRATLVGSLVLGAAVTAGLAVTREPLALRIGVFLLGLVSQMYRPAMQASVADLVPPERRARAYGLVYWAVNVGFGASLVIGGTLAATSFTGLFLADAATMLVFGLVVWRKVPETRPARAIAIDAAERAGAGGGVSARARALVDDLAPLLRDRVLLTFLALHFLFATVLFQFNVSVPIDMRRNGIGPQGYGFLMALNGITIALLQPFAARLLAPFERGRVLATAALLVGLGYGLFALVETPPLYALAIVTWTLGEICHTPMATATVADLAPAALRGRYQGAYGMAWGLAMYVGTQLGADVLGRFGPTALWGGCLAIGVATAAGQLAAGPARRRRLEAATEARGVVAG
jgi:MFS family permease